VSKVVIYGKQNCRYCSQAKFKMIQLRIPYTYRDVEVNPEARDDFLALTDPPPGLVPQVVISGQLIGGYDALEKHFEDPANIEAAREGRLL
jgi:glutaredoxin